MSIRSELESKLTTYAQANNLPVAWENAPFHKPTSGAWLECFLINNFTTERNVAATRFAAYGIFQVNVWFPEGKGMALGESIAYAIRDLYPIVPKTGTVSIEKTPTLAPTMASDGWRIIPVSIYWRQEQEKD
jgi:hypothetical protein